MNFTSVKQPFILLVLFLFMGAMPSMAQEHLKVGETKTLYYPSSITSKALAGRPSCWSTWNEAVSVTSYTYAYVTIKANAVTNSSYALIRVDYYYDQLFGNYMYRYTGFYDYRIYVDPTALTGISISPANLTLEVGETAKLTTKISPSNATNQNVTWSSSNKSVASISSEGIVNGLKIGTATITVTTADGGKTGSCTVTIKAAPVSPTSVSIPKSLSLIEGFESSLSPVLAPSDAQTTYKWTSSDTSIATVSAFGKITAKAAGTVNITVFTGNGLSAICELTVKKSPVNIDRSKISAITKNIQSLVQRTVQRIQ